MRLKQAKSQRENSLSHRRTDLLGGRAPSPCARSGSGTIHVAQAPSNHHQLPGSAALGAAPADAHRGQCCPMNSQVGTRAAVTPGAAADTAATFTLRWRGKPGTPLPISPPWPQGRSQDPRVLPSCTCPPFPAAYLEVQGPEQQLPGHRPGAGGGRRRPGSSAPVD